MSALRTIKLAAAAFAGITLFVLLLASCINLIWGRDIPPPNTSDLHIDREALPQDENAFTHFLAATNHFFATAEDREAVVAYNAGEANRADELKSILSGNRHAIAQIEEGAKLERCLTPNVERLDDMITYIRDWLAISKLFMAKAIQERSLGDKAAAAHTSITLMRFGYLVHQHPSSLIEYLVGLAILSSGLTEIENLLPFVASDPQILELLLTELNRIDRLEAGLLRAYKAEFRLAEQWIEDYQAGKLDINSLGVGLIPAVGKLRRTSSYFFKPEETKQLLAEHYRELIEHSDHDYAEIIKGNNAPAPIGDIYTTPNFFYPNAVGRLFISLMTPNLMSVLERKCRASCSTAALRILCAIHLYRNAHGQLPDHLEALVPVYLESVPLDPYDNKPLRYDRAKLVVYSVGANLTDDGGSTHTLKSTSGLSAVAIRFESEDAVFPIARD
jgi:hypothetical protein